MVLSEASMAFDESGAKAPLYRQIYLQIRDRITNGDFPDQSLLPSEKEISKIFNVSRITAKRALNEIAAEGLCERRRGQGSKVTYSLPAKPIKSDTQGLLDVFSDTDLKTESRVLQFDYIQAGKKIADVLEVDEETEIQKAVRVRHLEGRPISYLTTFVPAELGRKFTKSHLTAQAAVVLLERSGVSVANAEQTIMATLAEAVAAEALEVKQGAPLLRISRVVRDANERVVEYFVGLYRPDRFQYSTSLARKSDNDRHFWAAD